MSKQEIVIEIRKCNQTADEAFLMSFDDQALSNYLERLKRLNHQRGAQSVWVRQGETHSIVCRRSS